jgi:nitric oxide reductase large subunit
MAGFAVLIFISVWAYKYSPPIPKKVVNAAGDTVFTGEDILAEDVGEALAGDATNTPSTHSSPRSEKQ